MAGGLAAAQADVPVAQVEAGMRSFDPSMPEELNRVLTATSRRCCRLLGRRAGQPSSARDWRAR